MRDDERTRKHTRANPRRPRDELTQNARRLDTFERRHMGPSEKDQLEMLKTIGFESLDELVTSTVPANIRLEEPMELGSHTSAAMSETEALSLLRSMADKNKVLKSLIGQGYNETHTPYVILRNMLENPVLTRRHEST